MTCFWQAFAERDDALAVHTLHEGDRLLAVLPLRRLDRIAPVWQSVTNAHSPFWLFAFDEARPEIAEEIIAHLHEDADVIDLGPIHRDGPIHTMLTGAAQARGLRSIAMDNGVDMFVDLSTPDALSTGLSSKLRREVGRKTRQLERLGELRFETLTSGPELPAALEACFALEARSWKSEAGSAVLVEANAHRFYTELAHEAARHGRFALHLLYLDDRLIAYEYMLRAQHRIDMLKPSFEPELARYSPGNALRLRILENEAEHGEIASYHLGRAHPWKHQWARQTDKLCRLQIFAPGVRARLAYEFGPRAKMVLKSKAIVQRVRQRLRSRQSRPQG